MPPEEHHNVQDDSSPDSSRVITSFDELAKGLATGTVTRSKVLRWMGSALVGAALASVPGVVWANDCRRLGRECRRDSQCCSRNCVRRGDDKVCGCPEGKTRCNDRCVNLKRNERHCGECFNRCEDGEECVGGVCQGGGCPETCCCSCGVQGVGIGCTTEFTTLDQCTNWCFGELGGEGAVFNCLPNEFNPNTQVYCGADNICYGTPC
jgi:hypothetical protein